MKASSISIHQAAGCGGLILLLLVAGAAGSGALTRSMIHLALGEYVAALWLMIGMSHDGWRAVTSRGQLARWLWSWACLALLIHVACAFHFTHHWSQARAFEQTRLESGYGEGLYVNYLFMLGWTADVAWWWIAPDAYAGRTKWIDRLLHGFLLFIVFNATVVFERGAVRYAGAAGCLLVAMRWLRQSSRNLIAESDAITPSSPDGDCRSDQRKV